MACVTSRSRHTCGFTTSRRSHHCHFEPRSCRRPPRAGRGARRPPNVSSRTGRRRRGSAGGTRDPNREETTTNNSPPRRGPVREIKNEQYRPVSSVRRDGPVGSAEARLLTDLVTFLRTFFMFPAKSSQSGNTWPYNRQASSSPARAPDIAIVSWPASYCRPKPGGRGLAAPAFRRP